MPIAINAVNCKKYENGTGLVDCEPFFGEIQSVIVTPPNWSLPVTETFDLDYVVSKVQDGTFVPFLNTVQFTENTGDPARTEYSGGRRRTNRNANPDYMLDYDNGLGYHVASYSYNGYQGRVFFIDKSGNIQIQRNVSGTSIMGFLADDINTRTYRQQAGDTRPATSLEIHLANPEEFNRQMVLISVDSINANLNSELRGVVSVKLTVVSATATSVVVDVESVNNKVFGIEALAFGNFEINNVTDNAITTVGAATPSTAKEGRYTLGTFSPTLAASDSIIVQTKGYAINNATLITDSTQLYKGTSEPFTVTS